MKNLQFEKFFDVNDLFLDKSSETRKNTKFIACKYKDFSEAIYECVDCLDGTGAFVKSLTSKKCNIFENNISVLCIQLIIMNRAVLSFCGELLNNTENEAEIEAFFKDKEDLQECIENIRSESEDYIFTLRGFISSEINFQKIRNDRSHKIIEMFDFAVEHAFAYLALFLCDQVKEEAVINHCVRKEDFDACFEKECSLLGISRSNFVSIEKSLQLIVKNTFINTTDAYSTVIAKEALDYSIQLLESENFISSFEDIKNRDLIFLNKKKQICKSVKSMFGN